MRYFDDPLFKNISTHTPEPAVLGIGASPRAKGNSDLLLTQVLKGASQQGSATRKIHLRDVEYSPCIGCERCRKDRICTGQRDGMSLLYPDIIASRGLVLISPTHNYNITAWMKSFIDRLYCFYNFTSERPGPWSSQLDGQGRKAVIVGICEQETKADMGFTMEAMGLPLKALGYDIVGELPVLNVFGRGDVKKKEDTLAQAFELGTTLAQAVAEL